MAARHTVRSVEIDATTGEVVFEEEWEVPDTPLDSIGVMATLLAVSGIISVEDAANAVSLKVEDLIVEAQSWAAAQEMNNGN